jgi:hypothetical protein
VEAVELVTHRAEAEAIVHAWDRDEPEQAWALRVERIEFQTGTPAGVGNLIAATANWADG